MLGPAGYRLPHREKFGKFPVCHPAVRGDEVAEIEGMPPRLMNESVCKMHGQCDSCGRGIHSAFDLSMRATAILNGANPNRTASNGGLRNTISVKARARRIGAPPGGR